MDNQSIFACTRRVYDGKMIINFVKIRNKLNYFAKLLHLELKTLQNDDLIINHLRKYYNDLAHNDFSLDHSDSKNHFNKIFDGFAYVRDLT